MLTLKNSFFIKTSIFIVIFSIILSPILSYGEDNYDLVIKNGTVYNPSTKTILDNYNIGINKNKIKKITKQNITGKKSIDAKGLIVAPGFIDLISYDPNPLGIKYKVLDGVTTNLAMHGGTEDAETWYKEWTDYGVTTNFGASSFITRMRWPIVGEGIDSEINKKEDIDALVKSVEDNIKKGALGISFSLEYVPGIKNEIIPLLNLAKKYQLPTFYHLRYSDKINGIKGIEEVLDYARKTKASTHIMHINSTGGTFNMEKALNLIDKGLEDGLDITACIYPYDYWATYIDSARFREGWQERYNITYEDLQIGGTDIRITKDTFDAYRKERLLVAAHNSIPESDNLLALQHPKIMIGSDTIIESGGNNHPRGSGTYGRLFNKYVKTEKVLTVMDALEKITYLPAKRMEAIGPKMKYKGRIEIDSDADITIFDLENFKDNSTIENTELPSTGVEYVIINGSIVKDKDGYIENLNTGQPIRSRFIDKYEVRNKISYPLKYKKDKIYLDKVYSLDGKIYFNLKELFNSLKFNYELNSDNGNININKKINLKVADRDYNVLKKEKTMTDEIIIYEEDFYLSLDSFKDIFSDFYSINNDNSSLAINELETSKFLFEDKEKDRENLKEYPKKNYISLFLILPIIFISIFLIYIYKDKKLSN